MKKSMFIYALFLSLFIYSGFVAAEVKIVAHPSLKDASLTKEVAAKLFLGKVSNFPSGTKAIPIDQETGEEARDEFYQKVTNKTAAQLKSYWSRLIFTGQALPNKRVLDDDEVMELIIANPNLVGYVSGDMDTTGAKVLFSMP
ncbi:hypothetical protein A9Q99_06910 [Gammaproteobacteria bacterium 45_16_T64]|nr:hypothetical protein A9Q99_06910 [Gammaproteobacteria bacterium 45_16_T64]